MRYKFTKAFSLAELMIVILILTIILACTMPILSKRAKIKTAAIASTSNTQTCSKTINSNWNTTLTSNIQILSFTLTASTSNPTTILVDNVSQATVAAGGGSISGALVNLNSGQKLTVNVGGNAKLTYTTTASSCPF